ncbi:hypothetical protein BDN72DRAFT_842430 [Pluteus cervinus]|uniref:Uncharacterized protein n=1 Tax=Pluteus cervinus TaxID=181527 RepID=A0ACD3ARK2_9AGAR|nr:hypothetical protein BDN72DRAFT_842430 [Pluteus cervinus]
MTSLLRSRCHSLLIKRCFATSPSPPILIPQPDELVAWSRVHPNRRKIPYISTFLPEKLQVSDYIDWVGRETGITHTETSYRSPQTHLGARSSVRLNYASLLKEAAVKNTSPSRQRHAAFPPEAKGFLYLHVPDPALSLPRCASALRFRSVPHLPAVGDVYEAFQRGTDLIQPNGFPWSLSTLLIAGRSSLAFFRHQLLQDSIYTEEELEEFKKIYQKSKIDRRSHLIYSLDDHFPVRFDSTRFTICAIAGKNPGVSIFLNVFTDLRQQHPRLQVYSGGGHARFELSPNSRPQHPQLVVRVMKITEPVKCLIPDYDGYVNPPREGELVTRGLPGQTPEPWTVDIDPRKSTHSSMLDLL